ncbi:MAG: DUF6705 family protein [Bacteroidota bacterium]
MKLIAHIFLSLAFATQLSAQTIIDIAGERENKQYENGDYYFKDLQNLFQPYLGTWKYTDGNNEFRIIIIKVTMFQMIDNEYNINYYTDGLLISYKKYENGALVFQSQIDNFPSSSIKEFGKLKLTFIDYERIYKNTVLNISRNAEHDAYLNLIPNNTGSYNLHFKLYTEQTGTGLEYEPVQSGNPYHSTPTDIIMTKM